MGVRVRVRVVAVRVNPNLGQERHDPLAAPRRAHERGGEPRVRAKMQVAVGRHGAPRQDGALGRRPRARRLHEHVECGRRYAAQPRAVARRVDALVRVRVRVRVRDRVRVRVRVRDRVRVRVRVR